jgi:hypothetical protein
MRHEDHYTVGDALVILMALLVEYWWAVGFVLLAILAPRA